MKSSHLFSTVCLFVWTRLKCWLSIFLANFFISRTMNLVDQHPHQSRVLSTRTCPFTSAQCMYWFHSLWLTFLSKDASLSLLLGFLVISWLSSPYPGLDTTDSTDSVIIHQDTPQSLSSTSPSLISSTVSLACLSMLSRSITYHHERYSYLLLQYLYFGWPEELGNNWLCYWSSVLRNINAASAFMAVGLIAVNRWEFEYFAMILPGYQTSNSTSSSKFYHFALLVALVLH